MSVEIPIPAADARLDERDRMLHIADAAGEPVMTLRVDDGLVYVRSAAGASAAGGGGAGVWEEVALSSVLGLFAANTPVATWLRRAGANVMRLAMANLGAHFGDGDDS